MEIPNSKRKKALFIIDIQPAFINTRNDYIISQVEQLLKQVNYDLYIEAIFYSEKGSIWDKQQNSTFPKDEKFKTIESVKQLLNEKNVHQVEKDTKSVFKGNKNVNLLLKNNSIEEVHVVGIETDDCVLATAYEAFDLGYFTYVIEECCESGSSTDLHTKAIEILRRLNMTNNSVKEDIEFIEIL